MKLPITNINTIRQFGKAWHFFDLPNPHTWEGLSYAFGRNWRVVKTINQGPYTTYRCENHKEPESVEVKMICGVRIVLDKDGNPICH